MAFYRTFGWCYPLLYGNKPLRNISTSCFFVHKCCLHYKRKNVNNIKLCNHIREDVEGEILGLVVGNAVGVVTIVEAEKLASKKVNPHCGNLKVKTLFDTKLLFFGQEFLGFGKKLIFLVFERGM